MFFINRKNILNNYWEELVKFKNKSADKKDDSTFITQTIAVILAMNKQYFEDKQVKDLLFTTNKIKLKRLCKQINKNGDSINIFYINLLRNFLQYIIENKENLEIKNNLPKPSRFFLRKFKKLTDNSLPLWLAKSINPKNNNNDFQILNVFSTSLNNSKESSLINSDREIFASYLLNSLKYKKINERELTDGKIFDMCVISLDKYFTGNEINFTDNPSIKKFLRQTLKNGKVYYPTIGNIRFTSDFRILNAKGELNSEDKPLATIKDKETLFEYIIQEELQRSKQIKRTNKLFIHGGNYDRTKAINPLFGTIKCFMENLQNKNSKEIKESKKNLFIALNSLKKDLRKNKNNKDFNNFLHFYLNSPIKILDKIENKGNFHTSLADFLLFLSKTNLSNSEKRTINFLINKLNISKDIESTDNVKPTIYTLEQIKNKYNHKKNSMYLDDKDLYKQDFLKKLYSKKSKNLFNITARNKDKDIIEEQTATNNIDNKIGEADVIQYNNSNQDEIIATIKVLSNEKSQEVSKDSVNTSISDFSNEDTSLFYDDKSKAKNIISKIIEEHNSEKKPTESMEQAVTI